MELYKHQKQMINEATPILEKFNLVYIAAETRTGKTLATIFLLKDKYKSILVVTKKKAISSWNSDLKLANAKNFIVTNYESVHKVPDIDYDVIVLDESHSIGAYPKPSQRAKNIKLIAKGKRIVYLSATPSAETYSQIYHQLWVSSYSPFNEVNFYKWYKNHGEDDSFIFQGRTVRKYKAAYGDLIMSKINHLIVRMTKQLANFDVLVEEKIHLVDAAPGYVEGIKVFEKHRVLRINDYKVTAETPPDTVSKSHQLSGGTLKINDEVSVITSTHKVDYILRNLCNDKKIVVLCNYIKERQLLLSMLPSSTDSVEKFKSEDYKFFVGHVKTYSEGVDFSYADSMIIYSLNFSATTYLQSRERLANKKRVKPIVVHYLFTKEGIDSYIYEAVSNKMNFTSRYYRGCA
jgi:hypothetical protein